MWSQRLNMGVAAPALMAQFHWTPAVVGVILSAFSLGYLIMQIPGGLLSDALPAHAVFWAVLASSAWTALTPVPATSSLMGGVRGLVGLSQGPYLSGAAALVGRWIPLEERGRAQALTQSASNLAPVLFVPVAATLVHTLAWPSTFYLFGLMGGGWAVAWFVVMHAMPARRISRTVAVGRWLESRDRKPGLRAMRAVLRMRSTWGVVLSYFGVPYATFMLLGWLPTLFADRFHMPLVHAGLLTTLPFLVGFLAQLASGTVLDRLARRGWPRGKAQKLLIGTGYVGSAVFTLLATAHFQVGWVAATLAAATGFLGLPAASFWTLPIDISPDRAGSIAGVMNFAGVAGAVLSPIATGWLVASTGRWETAFYLLAIVLIVCPAVALALIDNERLVLETYA